MGLVKLFLYLLQILKIIIYFALSYIWPFFVHPCMMFELISLRVLLVKWPDICTPTFLVQYLFGCIIQSTYLGDVPKAKSWDLGAYTGLGGDDLSFRAEIGHFWGKFEY